MHPGISQNRHCLIVALFALVLVAVMLKPAAAQRSLDITNEPALKLPVAPVTQGAVSGTGATTRVRSTIAEGGNTPGYNMAPETRPEIVEAAVAAIPSELPPGPFKPTWESLKENYKVPQWFAEAKFGLSMHWGLYSVPAYHSEWYEKHMYGVDAQWHKEHFGPQDRFGYKDFIPMFTAEKFDPKAWAELFRKSGARWVAPTVQHHDNFALWDSRVTPFNAMQMGPKRDLMGELARAVRAEGLKFGVCNHGMENFQFIDPPADLATDLKTKQADLYDPKWADFYNVINRSDEACKKFLVNWVERNVELIEKLQPDVVWFDNGSNIRYLDPLKLWVAAYYYNRAAEWGKQVSIVTKKASFAPSNKNTEQIGSVVDFERIGSRSPSGIRTGVWEVHEPIGSTWGYTSNMNVSSAGLIIGKLADTASKNGNLLLNLSPKADGTIPQEQQDALLEIGEWLGVNGDAIYGTHNWIKFSEGVGPGQQGLNVRFTVKGDVLYAIILGDWPGEQAIITSLATGQAPEGKISSVTMLGNSGELQFSQDAAALKVKLPATAPCKYAYALKIAGLKTNPSTATLSGNPVSVAPVLNPKLPTIFVAGDSTAARANGQPQQGWAEPFAEYFDQTKVNIVNRARGGRSSRTFITEGLWDDLLADAKSGDIVLIQFGHNDGGALNDTSRARGSIRGIGEETEEIDNLLTKKHEVVHTYGWYLRKFITDARARGATPIICSLVPRKIWKDGKIVRGKDGYGGWAEAVARAEGVAFVDLNEIIAQRYDELGPDKVDPLFADEHTHTTVAGAQLNAECVITGLKALTNNPVGPYLRAAPAGPAPALLKFSFGPRPVAPGFVQVLPTTMFDKERGYGFEPCTNALFFSARLPEEGNYRVTVTLGDATEETTTTIKTELRRLMMEKIHTAPGKFATVSFIVNTRTPKIGAVGDIEKGEVKLKSPRETTQEAWAWDDLLTLEFDNARPAVCAVEIAKIDVPTVFLLGDSTVCDQSREPYASWGQMLPRFFKPEVAVANHGTSGETYRGSIGRRRLDKVLSVMKPGDYLIMQFGHNDQKQKGDGMGPFLNYKTEIKQHVNAVREHSGIPVVVSPVERRNFDENGKIKPSLADYAEAARQSAKESNAAFIDLNAMSIPFYEALGPEKSKLAFAKPDPDKVDNTHHDNYGAYELAKCIVQGIKNNKLDLAKYIINDFKGFDPSHPDPVESFDVPPSPQVATQPPLGN